jgi:hypothetical protein
MSMGKEKGDANMNSQQRLCRNYLRKGIEGPLAGETSGAWADRMIDGFIQHEKNQIVKAFVRHERNLNALAGRKGRGALAGQPGAFVTGIIRVEETLNAAGEWAGSGKLYIEVPSGARLKVDSVQPL